jgi:hypothetical protein
MLAVGLQSSLWFGLLSAILCGIATAAMSILFQPLGQRRAVLGALAFASTPVVFVASLSAMDFLWGITFFLAATISTSRNRLWWGAVFLGLAVASRPTYALLVVPMALLHVEFDYRRFAQIATWRRLAPPIFLAAAIAVAFFVPALLSQGKSLFYMMGAGPHQWLQIGYRGSVGLFGVLGCIAVLCAAASALSRSRRVAPVPDLHLDGWAITVIALWGVLFMRLPHDPTYLMPALVGLYWLLCRYARGVVLLTFVAALALSCFVFRVDPEDRAIGIGGPVLWDLQAQRQRDCIAGIVGERLAASADGRDYVVAGFLRPQLVVQLKEPLSKHVLHTVRPDESGNLVDTEWVPFPANARLWVLDRVLHLQNAAWDDPSIKVIATTGC